MVRRNPKHLPKSFNLQGPIHIPEASNLGDSVAAASVEMAAFNSPPQGELIYQKFHALTRCPQCDSIIDPSKSDHGSEECNRRIVLQVMES